MDMQSARKFLIFVIIAGAAFAWYTVFVDFAKFFDIEGTIFVLKNTALPNPVKTPCFYGAIGFLVALYWSYLVLVQKDVVVQKKQHIYLTLFLIGGTIFGWTNFFIGYTKFIANNGKPVIGCSGQIMTNPFTTPCFYGSVLYLVSLVVALGIVFLQKSKKTQKIDSPSSL